MRSVSLKKDRTGRAEARGDWDLVTWLLYSLVAICLGGAGFALTTAIMEMDKQSTPNAGVVTITKQGIGSPAPSKAPTPHKQDRPRKRPSASPSPSESAPPTPSPSATTKPAPVKTEPSKVIPTIPSVTTEPTQPGNQEGPGTGVDGEPNPGNEGPGTGVDVPVNPQTAEQTDTMADSPQ